MEGGVHFIFVQSCQLFVTSRTAACQVSLSITIFQNMLKLTSIESMMPFIHLVLCHPLILPSIFPSIMVFPNESALCIRWRKYWNFSISPSNQYSGLISFRIHWCDLLAIQGTLKSLLQHHSSKASILQHSEFFFFSLTYFFFSWMLITLQYCSSFFSYIDMNQPWIYMYSPSPFPLPHHSPPDSSGSSQCTRPEHLSHASSLGWWSVSP